MVKLKFLEGIFLIEMETLKDTIKENQVEVVKILLSTNDIDPSFANNWMSKRANIKIHNLLYSNVENDFPLTLSLR